MEFSSLPHSLYLPLLFPSFSEDAVLKQTILLLFFHTSLSSLSSELRWCDSIIWEADSEYSVPVRPFTIKLWQRKWDRKYHNLISSGQELHFPNKLMSGYSLTLVRSGINPVTKCSPAMWFGSGYVCDSLDGRAWALFPTSRDKAPDDKAASLKMQECNGSPTASKILKYFWDERTQFFVSSIFF